MLDATIHYSLLKTLAASPRVSQRDLAKKLGISLGKVNYCLNALVNKGSLKVNNFCTSDNKRAYAYLLTASGIDEKARLTVEFLKIKMREYEVLKIEIEQLSGEVEKLTPQTGSEQNFDGSINLGAGQIN